MSSEPGTVRIRLGVVSIAAVLVTVAALTTLVIVVAIREADLLSVVALALAVIAFSAQLIIYIVQAAESASATRRSLELHVELSGLLSELRERTGSTQRSMDTINSRLLEAVIGKTQRRLQNEAPDEYAERVAETYAAVSQSSAASPASTVRPSGRSIAFPDALPPSDAERIRDFMRSWPEADEVDEVTAVLGSLSNSSLSSLWGYSSDLLSSTRHDATFGPGLGGGNPKLLEAGLIEKIPGWKLHTLSEKGMRAARLFTAEGTPPRWIEPLLPLRNQLRESKLKPIDNRDSDL